ncbi:scavenger receptor class F member 1-like [Haliotis rubra]|uniref:scavenger receptor class F member 1-like n=1 Tax=Haliotis rubra TaxID=36100 RepID=UPI001EE614CD|nr:scavenger receptor class F member 1-like [Haliotis rubra]
MKNTDVPILRCRSNPGSTTSWIVTLVLGLLVCSARFISSTEVNGTHCVRPYDTPPCDCKVGWYGDKCTENCSSTCSSGYGCNKTTGKCVSCKAGYHSFNCTLKCPPNCLNESGQPAACDKDTAHCTNCQPTWWGSKCTNKCDSNCKNGVCDFVNGHCHECEVGRTGENCSEECPSDCWRRLCHRDNKTCTGGCTPGYFGETCDKKCGGNCKEVECTVNGTTDASSKSMCARCTGTGQCHSCKSGYWGDICDKLCPEQCTECAQNNGTCGSGSGGGSSSSSDRITGHREGEIAGSVTAVILLVVVAAFVIYLVKRTRGCNSLLGRCRGRRQSEVDENVMKNLAQSSGDNTVEV